MARTTITINRAPVLTLWAVIVAERLGFDPDSALTLGKAVAGLTAQSKGRRLGIFKPPKLREGKRPKKYGLGEEFWIELCGRAIPVKNTAGGVRAMIKDKPIQAEKVQVYLVKAFGGQLKSTRTAMEKLAKSLIPEELADRAFGLYEQFRPTVAKGQKGWGQKGELDLKLIRALATKA